MSSVPMFDVNKKKGRRRGVVATVASEAAAFSSGAATSSSADTRNPARDQERHREARARAVVEGVSASGGASVWRGESRGLGRARPGVEQAASSASASTAAELGRAQAPLLEAGPGSENLGPRTLGLGLVSALPAGVAPAPASAPHRGESCDTSPA